MAIKWLSLKCFLITAYMNCVVESPDADPRSPVQVKTLRKAEARSIKHLIRRRKKGDMIERQRARDTKFQDSSESPNFYTREESPSTETWEFIEAEKEEVNTFFSWVLKFFKY